MRFFAVSLVVLALAGCETTSGGTGDRSIVTREGASVRFDSASQTYSVKPRAGAGPRDYWCAVGKAASQSLSPTTRLYLIAPFAPGQAATFSTNSPPNGGQTTGLNIIGGSGDNSVSISQAKALCPNNSSRDF